MKEAIPEINNFSNEFEIMPPEGVPRSADRYVFFPGDLMSDRDKRSRPDYALGGENFGHGYPALNITRGILHRCRITPITQQPRPVSADEKIKDQSVKFYEPGELKFTGDAPVRTQHVKVFPGDQLETIVFGNREGGSKGIIELTAFKAMDFKLSETRRLINEVQLTFFPNWAAILAGEESLPGTLRQIMEIIGNVKAKYTDALIQTTADEMLIACGSFRLYGINYLEREATRIRGGMNPNGGYIHSYSSVADVLLRQLEIKRENLVELKNVNEVAPAAADNKMAEALLESAKAQTEMARAMMAQANASAAKAVTPRAAAPKQPAQPKAAKPEVAKETVPA